MPTVKLKTILTNNQMRYEVIPHTCAYTAENIAELAHVSGNEIAKTVVVKMDGRMAMVVLPASRRIDLEHLREISGARQVRLADELEFKDSFPDCELGAMPPFGNFYNMDVYLAKELTEDQEISFNAGNHMELIRMKYDDFERLVKPKICDLTAAPVRRW